MADDTSKSASATAPALPKVAPSVSTPSPTASLSLADLAAKHGQLQRSGLQSSNAANNDTLFSSLHLQADVMHGWTRHKFYKAEDVLLSDDDYLSALEAAKKGDTHDPANHRDLTVFTREQAEAKLASDLATTRAKPRAKKQKLSQSHAQYLVSRARLYASQKMKAAPGVPKGAK